MNRYIMIRRLRGPAFLLLVGVLALLNQFDILSWGIVWPLLLILLGVLMLAERAALAAEVEYPQGPYPGQPYPGAEPGLEPRLQPWQRTAGGRVPPPLRLSHKTPGKDPKEDNHEQRTSEHASKHALRAGAAPPPFPPYDPKTQWRVYREQQKAAWRAQRDAWKAQRHAMKANYVGAYGPRVPSVVGPVILIGVGVVALLVLTGHIAGGDFWAWYGQWWPLLLIGAGLALLGEWALDLRREVPVRRGGSFVGIIILLAFLGFCAAGWNHYGPWFTQWNGNDSDFFNSFGLPEHDNDQKLLSAQIPGECHH